jgi:hypothetical protein
LQATRGGAVIVGSSDQQTFSFTDALRSDVRQFVIGMPATDSTQPITESFSRPLVDPLTTPTATSDSLVTPISFITRPVGATSDSTPPPPVSLPTLNVLFVADQATDNPPDLQMLQYMLNMIQILLGVVPQQDAPKQGPATRPAEPKKTPAHEETHAQANSLHDGNAAPAAKSIASTPPTLNAVNQRPASAVERQIGLLKIPPQRATDHRSLMSHTVQAFVAVTLLATLDQIPLGRSRRDRKSKDDA